MNNEPVAWIDQNSIDGIKAFKSCGEKAIHLNLGLIPEDGDIPLYTHPVKELTDEELFKVYADLEEGYTGNNFPVDLGRAILRKAQGK